MEERPVTFVVHFVEAVGSGVRGHGAIRKDFDKTVEYSWFTRQVESMAKSTTHTPYHYAKHPHDDPNVADIPLRIRWKRSLERVAALRIARSTKADPKESYRFYFCIWRTASPGILIRNVQGSDGPVPSWRELAIATYNMNVHVNVFGPGTSVQDLELFQRAASSWAREDGLLTCPEIRNYRFLTSGLTPSGCELATTRIPSIYNATSIASASNGAVHSYATAPHNTAGWRYPSNGEHGINNNSAQAHAQTRSHTPSASMDTFAYNTGLLATNLPAIRNTFTDPDAFTNNPACQSPAFADSSTYINTTMSAMSPTVSTATFVANPVSSSHYTFTNTLASTHIPAFASTLASLHTDASANSSFTPQTTLYNADTSHQATAGVYQAAAQVLGQSLPATRAHNGHTPQHQIPFSNGSYASPPAPIAQSGIGQAVTSVNQSQDFAPAPRMPLAILSRQQQSVQVAAQTQSVPPNGFHQAPHSYPTQPLPAQSGFASPPTQSQIGPSRSTTHQYRDGSQILSSPRPPKRAAPDTVHQEAPPIKSTRRTINQSHQSAAPSPSIQAYLPMTTGQAPTTNPVPPRPGVARAAAHKETPHHIPAQSTFDQRPVVTPNPTVSQVPRTKDPRRRSNNQSTQQRPPAVAQTPAPQPAPAPRPESSRKRPAPDTIHERAPATKIARKADVQGPSAPPNIYSTNAQPVQKQVLMNQTSPQTQMHIARPQATASTTRTLPQGVQNLHRPFLACSTGPLSHLVKSVQDIKFPELRRDDETEELVIDWKIPPAEFVNQCQAVAVQMKELVPPKPVPFCGSLRDLERRQPEQLVSARSPQAAEMSKLLDNLRFWANTVAERANGGVDAAIADNPVIIPAAASRDSADLRTGKSIVKSEPQEVTLAPMSSVPDDVVFQGILAEVIHIEDCLPDM